MTMVRRSIASQKFEVIRKTCGRNELERTKGDSVDELFSCSKCQQRAEGSACEFMVDDFGVTKTSKGQCT